MLRHVEDETTWVPIPSMSGSVCSDILSSCSSYRYSVLWKGHNTFGIGGVSLTLSTHESKCRSFIKLNCLVQFINFISMCSTKYACGCINRFLEDFLNSLSSWTESYFHSHVMSCTGCWNEGVKDVPCWVT